MRFIQAVGSAVALASHVSGQVQSTRVCDGLTNGICWSSYTTTDGIQYSVALPSNTTAPVDAVLKVVAPVKVTWAGFCWGGTMVFNPLTVSWQNGKSAIPSSRFAFGLNMPAPYDGAEYTMLKGTTSNATHWTMIARCRGCTQWQGSDGEMATLNATGETTFAFAQGSSAVAQPSNNASNFGVHSKFGTWTHDLNAARNLNFDSWVATNVEAPVVVTTSATSSTATTLTTSTSTTKPVATGKVSIPASCSGAGNAQFSSVLASGWKATKVLGGLTSPRSIVFDLLGNMLVIQNGKGITIHTMTAEGCISATKTLVAANNLNHGIALSIDGKTLYASTSTTVYSWPYTASSQTVGTRGTVVTGMYNGGSHTSRTLLIAPHQPNLLVVSHGSNANFDTAAGNKATARAIVKVFDLSKAPSAGYNYVSQGYNAGYGLRNEVGIVFDGNNMLWGVENSGDDFKRTVNGQSKDIHIDNPAEKLNYLGDVTKPNDQWYGYPTCFAVWKPSDFTDSAKQVGDHFVISPNATFKDDNCKSLVTPPSLVFQAHSAPIDSKFDPTFSTMYITFHGSWNRSPTTGFKVVAVAFTKGSDGVYKPVAPLTSNTAATDIFWNPNVANCAGNGPVASSGCFRPAGLGFDSKGRMYMTSDTSTNGELWVLGKP